MPSKERVLDAYMEAYLARLTKEGRAARTVQEYRRLIKHATDALLIAGLEASPKKVGEAEIDYLRNELYCDLEPVPARRQLSIIGSYLKWHGNPILEWMKVPWPTDMRIHADWLDPVAALRLMDQADGMERIIIHLELFMGLRRVEVLRLRLRDLKQGYAEVLGKGRNGGKPRTVPYFQDTVAELGLWFKEREAIVLRARDKEPTASVPEDLLIYEKGGRLIGYSKTAVDSRVKAVSRRSGTSFSNHTLRRTYGRMLYQAGVRLEVISELMGHESPEQTKKYLGLGLDDMGQAQRMLGAYADALKKGKAASSQQEWWAQRDLAPPFYWPSEFLPYLRASGK